MKLLEIKMKKLQNNSYSVKSFKKVPLNNYDAENIDNYSINAYPNYDLPVTHSLTDNNDKNSNFVKEDSNIEHEEIPFTFNNRFSSDRKEIDNFPIHNENNVNEKNTYNHDLEIEKLKNEIFYKDMQIEELNLKNEKNKNTNSINEEIKKIIEVNENLKKFNEGQKNENLLTRNQLIKKEGENTILTIKLSEAENEKINLEKKNLSEEALIKSLKLDYNNMNKNLSIVKKQFENLTNKFEEFKAENYLLKQENSELKKKISVFEKNVTKNNNLNINVNINKSNSNEMLRDRDQERNEYNNYNSYNPFYKNSANNLLYTSNNTNTPSNTYTPSKSISSKLNNKLDNKNDDVYYPSESKLKEGKNELNFTEQKLSELLKEKLLSENELFKLPDKPRTINEINKKRGFEESLKNIENEINEVKFRIRKLNGK